jgi:hypothetical protein
MKRRIIESGTVPGIESPIVHYLVALALRHRSRQSICSGFSRAGLMQERKVQTHACVLRIKRHVQIERPGWRRERERERGKEGGRERERKNDRSERVST